VSRFLTSAARTGILASYFLLGSISLLASVPEAAVRLPIETTVWTLWFLPQGWAFFTRNPREPVLEAWVVEDGLWRMLPLNVSGTEEVFGFRRTLRLRAQELGALAASLQPQDWQRCSGNIGDCVDAGFLTTVTRVVNRSVARQLCGNLVLAVREPQPWAWRGRTVSMPTRATRIHAECRH
jgi:antimicrobial peptide system SdpA family protein